LQITRGASGLSSNHESRAQSYVDPTAPTQIHCSKCALLTVPPVIAVADTVKAFVAAFAVKSVITHRGTTPNERANVTAIAVLVVVQAPTLSLEPATSVQVVVVGGAELSCGEATQWPFQTDKSGMVNACAKASPTIPAIAIPEIAPPQ
jgi:hypothetical protein